MSRRAEMLQAALHAFAIKGYDGTSIADLAEATDLSKAAFSYHFSGKDEILLELAEPLIADLEAVVAGRSSVDWPQGVRSLLESYLEALLRHRDVVVWVDGDKSVLNHPEIGTRLRRNNRRMRQLISGSGADRAARVRASAVLGAIWRPVRNLTDIDVAPHRDEILSTALRGFRR